MAIEREDTLTSGSDPSEDAEDRIFVERFNAFYEFAFPRVYRYAQRRMDDEAQAQALCRLVLVRAVSSLGGLFAIESRMRQQGTDFAFWLFCLSRTTADHLSAQLAEHPELLTDAGVESSLEQQTLEFLRGARDQSSNDGRGKSF